jgi:hypothetical protein
LGADGDCGTVITVTDFGAVPFSTGLGPYDCVLKDGVCEQPVGSDDTLVGVVNNSSKPIFALGLSSNEPIFAFDGDGITTYGAPGNALDATGYGGPNAYFVPAISASSEGTVKFVVPIPPGSSDYFALETALTDATSCQDAIDGSITTSLSGNTSQEITARFTPQKGLTIAQAAELCGVATFEWQQEVTELPMPFALHQRGSSAPLSAPPAFLDPPAGAYTELTLQQVPDSYPFFYDLNRRLPSHIVDSFGFPVSADTATGLTYSDDPKDTCLPGGQDAGTSVCDNKTAPAGSFMGFLTHLVGVTTGGLPVDLGIGFRWRSTFNGASGGISGLSQFKARRATGPRNGTGGIQILHVQETTNYTYNGVTVTSVNGTATTPSPPTRAEIRKLLLREIVPKLNARRIPVRLRRRFATLRIKALTPGSVAIQWLARSARRHAKPVLIAAGSHLFTEAGSATVTLGLTATGRKLLKSGLRQVVTAKGTFAPYQPTGTVAAKKTFALHR